MAAWQRLSDNARQAILAARNLARAQGCGTVSPAHLVLGILAQDACLAVSILRDMGVDTRSLRQHLTDKAAAHATGGQPPDDIDLTVAARQCMQVASIEARKDAGRHGKHLGVDFFVSTAHLLLGLVSPASTADMKTLRTHGVFYGELRELLHRALRE